MKPQNANPSRTTDPHSVERIPAQSLLEALARIYELVLVTDSAGLVLWMSDGLSAQFGSGCFQVGLPAQAILPHLPPLPKPEQTFALRSQLRRQDFLSNGRIELMGSEGKALTVEVNIVPVSARIKGRPFYVVIARPCCSDEENTGRAMHSQNDNSQSALDNAPDGMLIVDTLGFVTYANTAVRQLVGLSGNDILDRPVAALLTEALDLEQLVSSLGVSREQRDWELMLTQRDGRSKRVSVSAWPQCLEDGRFNGTVLRLRDVKDRKPGTEARNEITDRLQKKNTELQHCIHALAHDLRSPLVALLGFSRLLRQDYAAQLNGTGTHFIDRIEQAGRTMEDLIHDLLELSRIGQPGEQKAMVNPKAVLTQLQAELKPRFDASGTQFEFPMDPPLIFCDRTRLYQVFSNLIGNALDHMGACEDPRIVVSISEEAKHHKISVSDSGKGIAAEYHEQIFDVFQSLGPASDGRRGTGIGLAVVKKIAETHGGQISLESSTGRGSKFQISFPRR